jgi:hypothetical protein
MSWILEIRTTFETYASDFARLSPPEDAEDHEAEQFENARRVAKRLIESGVVGKYEDTALQVVLAGHSNPDHARPGSALPDSAPDRVSVQIVGIPAEALAEERAEEHEEVIA